MCLPLNIELQKTCILVSKTVDLSFFNVNAQNKPIKREKKLMQPKAPMLSQNVTCREF